MAFITAFGFFDGGLFSIAELNLIEITHALANFKLGHMRLFFR